MSRALPYALDTFERDTVVEESGAHVSLTE